MFAVGWGANQFSPMLLVYRDEIGLDASTRAALFGVYAAGLIPGLLLGGRASDRRGRRSLVLPFVALSPLATLILILGREEPALLATGRLLAGVCSGVVFGTASAWVQELSAGESPGVPARRAAIALSAGFGAGPLAAALVAQWAPGPLIVPYLPHLVLAVVALALLLPVPEPARVEAPGRRPLLVSALRIPRFRRIALLLAPWVFGFASISAVVLPARRGGGGLRAARGRPRQRADARRGRAGAAVDQAPGGPPSHGRRLSRAGARRQRRPGRRPRSGGRQRCAAARPLAAVRPSPTARRSFLVCARPSARRPATRRDELDLPGDDLGLRHAFRFRLDAKANNSTPRKRARSQSNSKTWPNPQWPQAPHRSRSSTGAKRV